MSKCKYYTEAVYALHKVCKALYRLDGGTCGGPLHIWLDDGNNNESDILFCLDRCQKQPELNISKIGIYICERYLKMSKGERQVFELLWYGHDIECKPGTCILIKENENE